MKNILLDLIRDNQISQSSSIVKTITEINFRFNIRLILRPQRLLFMNSLKDKLERDFKNEKSTYNKNRAPTT